MKIVEYNQGCSAIAPIPDSSSDVLISHKDKTIKVFNIETGKGYEHIAPLKGHTDSVSHIVLLSLDKIITSSKDKTIRIWHLAEPEPQITLEGHTDSVNGFVVMPNGLMVSFSVDKTIRVWDIKTRECLKILEGHMGSIYAVAMLYNNQIISSSHDNTMKIWDIDSGRCLKTLIVANGSRILQILPNGYVATNHSIDPSIENAIEIWDIDSGECLKTLVVGKYHVGSLKVLPNAQIITSSGGILKVWPRRLIYSAEESSAIENKFFAEALRKNDNIQILDFSGTTLSNILLALISKTLLEFTHWEKIENMSLYNDEGFEPIATFIDDARVSFELTPKLVDIRSPDGGTILHYLVRLYSDGQHNKSAIEKLMRECLQLGVDKLAQDKEGKIAARLASKIGAKKLISLLQINRPAFDIPQVVLDWCTEQQGWHDVEAIDGSKAEMILVNEKMTVRESTPPKTQILSVQNMGTEKRNITQTVVTTSNTEQYVTLKLDRTLAASNKTVTARMKSQEQLDTQRSQKTDSSSQEQSQASSNSSSRSSQQTTRSVESSNWHASASTSFFFVSVEAGGGGSSEHSNEQTSVQSNTSTNQSGSRDAKSTQSMQGKEHSERQSESSRAEQEQQKQLSIASGEQQQSRQSLSRREEYSVVFDKGYQFINSEKQTTWTEYKYIKMQYSLGGQVGIYRCSAGEILYIPLYEIFKDRKSILKQIYPDYRWKFEEENIVYCTIGGNYVERNVLTEKINEEHPLYRIKRLIEKLVMEENKRRLTLEPDCLAWMVNVTVDSNKINPYIGTIEIRCSKNTDTKLLKKALEQIINFSPEEMMSITKLPNGFTLFTLTFLPQNALPSPSKKLPGRPIQQPSTRPGLTRVNSGEFKLAFFNQRTLVERELQEKKKCTQTQRETAFLVCEVMKKVYSNKKETQHQAQIISFDVDKTTLQIRFNLQILTHEHKIQINALRLALLAFLEHTPDDQLPEAKRLFVTGQWAFCLDFADVNENAINVLETQTNHKYLIQRFDNLYMTYFEELKSVEPSKLREKKDSLYYELRQSQQKSQNMVLDF